MKELFWFLVKQINELDSQFCRGEIDVDQVQEKLLILLNLIKDTPQESDFFKSAFIDMVSLPPRTSTFENCPDPTVPFCMHELRWEEVKQKMSEAHNKFYCEILSNDMLSMLDSFEDDWENRDEWPYFA